jgi:hypothetical protein
MPAPTAKGDHKGRPYGTFAPDAAASQEGLSAPGVLP